jgi:IS4 transposase
VVHPPGGEIGIGLRSRARDVDGQNVAWLFKWIKQHLRIKKFLGTSENAVKTQVWCAIATYVLIAIVKK